MRKLSLDLEHLVVETFHTTAGDAESHGTVQGHAAVSASTCMELECTCETAETACGTCRTECTCAHQLSCAETGCLYCMWSAPTCGYSCPGTCIDETCDICFIITE